MKFIEEEGNTVEEALEKALKKVGVAREEAKFEVVRDGGSGEAARIRLYIETEEIDFIEETTKKFLQKLGTQGSVEIHPLRKGYAVNITTRGFDSLLIGKGGRTLEALEHILGLIVKRKYPEITLDVDVSNYKKRRKEFLINKALAIAKRVKETGKEMRMDPLSPVERRIVREALKRDKAIRTYTVGRGDDLILVIAPAH